MSTKPTLSGTVIMLLLVISVPLSTSILSSSLPSLIYYQQAIAQKTAVTAIPNFLTYHNSTYGINVQYPSDWIYKGSENTSNTNNNSNSGQVQTIVTFVPQNKSIHALVTIGTVNLPAIFRSIHIDNMSSFASLVISNIKQSTPGFRLIESKATTVNTAGAADDSISSSGSSSATIPAQRVVYTAAGPVHKTLAVYAINGDKAFFISYLTETEGIYSSYLPIAQKMIDSFQIVNAKPTTANIATEIPPIRSGTFAVGNNNTISELNAAREQLLLVWNRTGFRSQFDTFVNSADGYGVYDEHKSNIFKPGEPIVLYVEPVGFTHKPLSTRSSSSISSSSSGNGNSISNNNTKLYLINMTAGIVLSDKQGNILLGKENIPLLSVVSHNKNTELFMRLRLAQSSPFPAGDYVVTYTATDVPSGKSFKIIKDIIIAGKSTSNATAGT